MIGCNKPTENFPLQPTVQSSSENNIKAVKTLTDPEALAKEVISKLKNGESISAINEYLIQKRQESSNYSILPEDRVKRLQEKMKSIKVITKYPTVNADPIVLSYGHDVVTYQQGVTKYFDGFADTWTDGLFLQYVSLNIWDNDIIGVGAFRDLFGGYEHAYVFTGYSMPADENQIYHWLSRSCHAVWDANDDLILWQVLRKEGTF